MGKINFEDNIGYCFDGLYGCLECGQAMEIDVADLSIHELVFEEDRPDNGGIYCDQADDANTCGTAL